VAVTKLPIDRVKVGNRFRRDLGDIGPLAASIREIGLLHPVVVAGDGTLIAGWRRLRACEMLGLSEVPVNVVPLKDIIRGQIDENQVRKDFTVSEMVEIKWYLKPQLEGRAGRPAKNGAESAQFPKGRTREIIADYLGVSHFTLTRADAIVATPEGIGTINTLRVITYNLGDCVPFAPNFMLGVHIWIAWAS